MKLKLEPHHIAEISQRAGSTPIRQWAVDVRALLEHIGAIEEELQERNAFIASLPPIDWRSAEEMSRS